MTEAEIVAWHVKPGQAIREEDPLVDIMTDKATVELPAPMGGTVIAINGKPGEKRPVGSELVVLDVAGVGNAAQDDRPVSDASPQRQPAKSNGEGAEVITLSRPRLRRGALAVPRCGRGASSPALRPEAAGLAGGQAAGLGSRHRIAIRARLGAGRPHCPSGSRCVCRRALAAGGWTKTAGP